MDIVGQMFHSGVSKSCEERIMLSITALQHWGCCIVSLPFRDMIIEQSNSSIFSNNDLTHISLHTSNSYVVRTQYYYNDSV